MCYVSILGALNDLWTMDTRHFEWTKVETHSTTPNTFWPSPRYRHTANQIGDTVSVVIIGGWEKSGELIKTNNFPCIVYDTVSRIWTTVNLDGPPRAGHTTATVSDNDNILFVTGGEILKDGERFLTNQTFVIRKGI